MGAYCRATRAPHVISPRAGQLFTRRGYGYRFNIEMLFKSRYFRNATHRASATFRAARTFAPTYEVIRDLIRDPPLQPLAPSCEDKGGPARVTAQRSSGPAKSGQSAYSVRASGLWNTAPLEIRRSPAFEGNLKSRPRANQSGED
ncbi:hypothetical protein AAFF_G00166980 [Aldrovandia affinis]|uniref:Uncharacterized protein n=1 Tax=Aldrovandia affinis TaxID=143900 RepID=A0AAD7RM71_9TELE|nr:hypothetical protein AAFF_G00166980 [Aldrovandia affinis]